ncbi:MAG TPA: CHRD domain-containing protein [Bryobacteraceae bacterium]
MKLTQTILAATLFTAAIGQASPVTMSGILSGANESPATGSLGTGFATVTYDSLLHTLTVDVSFSGLTGTTTASHIHCCVTAGGNAGVATTTPTFAGFPLGVTAGTYHNVLDLTLAGSWNPAFITANGGTTASAESIFGAAFDSEQTYLNIHTSTNTGGEIRAFLTPEPTTWTLVGLSFLAFLAARKRLRTV